MGRPAELEQSLAVLIPSAWTNDQKGKFLEQLAEQLLRRQSYELVNRIRFTGMELDLLARHKPSSESVYVECKFHTAPLSANVIDLMLGQAFRRQLRQLALFSIGPLSKEAKGAVEELKGDGRVSFSFYGPELLLETLVDSAAAPRLPTSIPASFTHATLVVHPETPYIWLFQDQRDGRPFRLVPHTSSSEAPTPSEVRALLDKHELLEGLPVAEYVGIGRPPVESATTQSEQVEVVGRVTTADTILDYRPCRPQDFVGRLGLQQEIWNLLESVRLGETETRLLAIIGASGYGKSSLVAKIAERFRNKKWKNKQFLFPVDVRSARGPLFVAEAVLHSIRNAAEAGFVTLPNALSVTNADGILESESIGEVLTELEREGRVLVIFFDQFEEVFTKDDLLPVFRVFRRFALDVQARKANLVIGFSWRTGISLSNDNPAYQLWNELRDHRVTKQLGPFDGAEASGLLSQFETELNTKLLPPLRRRIQEQGQGVPWFLKKLCIHIHTQIQRGASQFDLLGSRLNVQSLFDEDLDPLPETQLHCLRYIASNSPVDSLDVYERYGNDVVRALIDKRLVVRAGQRFAVYWDIFRDYLTEGKVPAIPWTYIPNCSLGMALAGCNEIQREGPISTPDLATALSYSEATAVNIVTDLQNLALCGKDDVGRHILLEDVDMANVPERICSQFAEHVLYETLLEQAGDSRSLSRSDALAIVQHLYSGADVKAATRNNYLSRLLPWLEYAGLAEAVGNEIKVFSSDRRGLRFGRAPARGRTTRGALFLACATPELTEALLQRVLAGGVTRTDVDTEKLRNLVTDLSALGLVHWKAEVLAATRLALVSTGTKSPLRKAVTDAPTIIAFRRLMTENLTASRLELGLMLADELRKQWKDSSAIRYANGLFRYHEYVESSGRQ
jgi:Holliday junction resolvase-like predicted endonuclease